MQCCIHHLALFEPDINISGWTIWNVINDVAIVAVTLIESRKKVKIKQDAGIRNLLLLNFLKLKLYLLLSGSDGERGV